MTIFALACIFGPGDHWERYLATIFFSEINAFYSNLPKEQMVGNRK